jgi:FkbM family methyltransferase
MLVARTDVQRVRGVDATVGVSTFLLEQGSYSQGELDDLLKLSSARRSRLGSDNFTVLDIGANVGAFAIPWAKFLTGWGGLIAVEAQERLFGALWGNITLNNLFNARAIWAAAADQCGLMPGPTMDYEKTANFGGVSMLPEHNAEQPVKDYQQIVPAITVDSLNLRRVDVIKIDVEGMEPHVLRGARDTIRRNLPILSIEHHLCGKNAICAELPDYVFMDCGIHMLCLHRDDPLTSVVKVGEHLPPVTGSLKVVA